MKKSSKHLEKKSNGNDSFNPYLIREPISFDDVEYENDNGKGSANCGMGELGWDWIGLRMRAGANSI